MAQDTFISIVLDMGPATDDPGRMKHTVVGGASGVGDVSFQFDHTKLVNLNQADTVLALIRNRLIAAGLK